MNLSKEECRRIIEKTKENTRIIFIGQDAEQEVIHKRTSLSNAVERMKRDKNISFSQQDDMK